MLRYLLLYLEGGIYTDTDTTLLQSPRAWGQGVKLWRDGAGWIEPEDTARIAAGEKTEDVLGPPSVIVGVEADVGDRVDWNDWWPRPVSCLYLHALPLTADANSTVDHGFCTWTPDKSRRFATDLTRDQRSDHLGAEPRTRGDMVEGSRAV